MNRISKLLCSATPILMCCNSSENTKDRTNGLSCQLTSPELQQRKEIVLKNLLSQVIEKKDLKSGYAFKFQGTDCVIDQLSEFIKTERECCDFFDYELLISGNKSEIWLEVMGPEGAKNFIAEELGI